MNRSKIETYRMNLSQLSRIQIKLWYFQIEKDFAEEKSSKLTFAVYENLRQCGYIKEISKSHSMVEGQTRSPQKVSNGRRSNCELGLTRAL